MHTSPECTGEWECLRIQGRLRWRCNRCRAFLPVTPYFALAAARENALGSVLRALGRSGAHQPPEERGA
ncbi:MAG: hypothetical protein M3409_05660 [Gemmatimonadota bacterium]|jgi:hypothetical protein|nr:hypothetical protein [Gemmatimonadota bacterium]